MGLAVCNNTRTIGSYVQHLSFRALLVPVASVALTLQVTPIGQQQNEPSAPPFRAATNFVQVDVYASAKGTPVLDLTRDDFEVREEGVPQAVATFERIDLPAGPQSPNVSPPTIAESREAVQRSRARVVVVFLDVPHVTRDAARSIGPRVARAISGFLGPEDLVGLMTPDMRATDVTFARGTETVARTLTQGQWAQRGELAGATPDEEVYKACYPGLGPTRGCEADDRGIADEMIARRRERQTLAALADLVSYLRDARDERKAVLVVSDGWRLYGKDARLARDLVANPLPPRFVPNSAQVGSECRVVGRQAMGCRCDVRPTAWHSLIWTTAAPSEPC